MMWLAAVVALSLTAIRSYEKGVELIFLLILYEHTSWPSQKTETAS